MARTIDLKMRIATTAIGCAMVVGAMTTLFLIPADRSLRLANIVVPVVTLGLLWVIWLRQRRIAKLTDARLAQDADAYARLAALSDVIEDEYLSRRLRRSHDAVLLRIEDSKSDCKDRGPTIH